MLNGTIDFQQRGFTYKFTYAQTEQDENGGTFTLITTHDVYPVNRFDGTLHDLMQLSNEQLAHPDVSFSESLRGLKMKSSWWKPTDQFFLENERQFIKIPLELFNLIRERLLS